MNERGPTAELVGRELLLGRLAVVVARAVNGERSTALVGGQAGIGKTSLVRAAAELAAVRGARVAWGTCVEGAGAPGYWPWTQALNGLARAVGLASSRELAGEDASLLATVVTALGRADSGVSDQAPLLLMDASTRWLDALAAEGPVMIVLDDLQWADESSLALLDFLVGSPQTGAICIVAAYRDDELSAVARERVSRLLAHADHVHVDGLDVIAVQTLVERVVGAAVPGDVTSAIHRRSAGHPFFVRELALASTSAAAAGPVPIAVREAIERRLRQLPIGVRELLVVAAVAGTEVAPDVVASALGASTFNVEHTSRAAVAAGVLVLSDGGRLRFAHDLFRETLIAGLDPVRRVALHRAVGEALENRVHRGGEAVPSELARHFTAAIALDGTDRAARWALAAAEADRATLAFSEAAGHLRRFRAAATDAGASIEADQLVEILLAEADALARFGTALDAKGLLRMARDVAARCGDARTIALVAIAGAGLGSRFAARRDEVIGDLEVALTLTAQLGPSLEAQLTATLARELQHSVPEERPRAGPLSERALELGRRADDPTALLACLLARHDVLWTPGTADERAEIAREFAAVAHRAGDDERHAQGLLLLANAELERGSGAYMAALDACLAALDELGQPRHHYTAETRRAAVALLSGDLDAAADRIEAAAHLGRRIREPDTDNVRMSQRLELVRAGGDPSQLQAFASEAVEHWTGAPVHANAVAAGFHARAGDVEQARRHVAAVVDLGTWRADRSYLRSAFVRELSWAAIALGDRDLCDQLFDHLTPLTDACGVNGAFVAFAGSHAHTAGLLAAALDRNADAAALLERARATYERLGARGWLNEINRQRACTHPPTPPGHVTARMRKTGPLWHLSFAGREVTVPDAKGLADIAALTSRPGTDVHALELIGGQLRSGSAGAVVDRAALQSYRQRLADLDDDAAEATRHNDEASTSRIASEREAILAELRQVTAASGQARQFANHPAERARKAVSARIRAAIASLEDTMPDLAEHLNLTIVTGTICRYRAEDAVRWEITLALKGDDTDRNP